MVMCCVYRSPLQQAPALQALLPPEKPVQLLTGASGFEGWPARATVIIQSALASPVAPALRQGARYSVMYR